MCFKSHIWRKKKRVSFGFARVTRVWPGCCHSQSFVKPGPVQPPCRPGPGSTRRAGPGLITVDPIACLQPVLPLQDCYFPRTRSWARDVVHDWIRFVAVFQLPCWIEMEKTHDCSPATVLFRQKWKFSLWPLLLEI
jgi:hypothetical protein